MKEAFTTFLIELVNDVPHYIYEMLISLTCILSIIFFITYRWEKAIISSLRLLFWEYLFMTYCTTIFFRPRINDVWHDFSPFWSYKAWYTGENPSLLPEIIMNIVGFLPLGFLMAAAYRKLKWWQVILMGLLVSLSIESIQYLFKLGIAEFDDVFNNTLGTAIGVALFSLTYLLLHKTRRLRI